MDRKLGVFETAQALTDGFAPFNVVIMLGVGGDPRPEFLRAVLDRLQRRHPLLRAHLIQRGSSFYYETQGTPEIPLELSDSDPARGWQAAVERELNRAFDTGTGPLMRVTLCRTPGNSGRWDLVLSFHHAIIDGVGAAELIRELLDGWNELSAGSSLADLDPLPLARPVEEFFPQAFKGLSARRRVLGFFARQMADEAVYRWRARGTRKPPVHESGQCRILCRDHPWEGIDSLARTARRHRVSLNSALNAALLLTVQKRLYQGQAVPLRNFNFALLRRFLDPPMPDEHLGSYHVMLRFTVPIEADQDFWELTQRINSQVHRSNRRGDKYCSLLMSAGLMRMILRQRKMRMGNTALAYTGPTAIGPSFGELSIQELHAFVSNLVLGPEYAVQARLFGDRLWWDVIYLDSDMDAVTAETIADEMIERLLDAARD
jgi:hypothetical protein